MGAVATRASRKLDMVLLLFCLLALVNTAPFPQNDVIVTKDNFNFTNSYIQFFGVKDLIEHINLKKFTKFHKVGNVEDISSVQVAKEGDQVTEIDLTDEAILNDKVTVNSVELEQPTIDNTYKKSPTNTLAPVSFGQEDEATTVSIVVEVEEETIITTTSAVPNEEEVNDGYELTVDEYDEINEIDTGDNKLFVSKNTAEAAHKYGYKILLKKVGSEEIPIGQIKFSLPTEVEIEPVDDPLVEDKEEEIYLSTQKSAQNDISAVSAIQSTQSPEISTIFDFEPEADNKLKEVVTTTITEVPITEPTAVYLPPPITAIVATGLTIDEESIVKGIMKVKEETVSAIDEIMSSAKEDEDGLLFPECSAPLEEVKDMLSSLALNVAQSTPILSEILATGESLKDITNLEDLARGGAKLLTLLEPFLDTLLPSTQVSDCAGGDSVSMVMSLSGVATKLDMLANEEEDPEKADKLHQTATSLQLAAWVMAQLQKSVHTFYTPEGLCGQGSSSAVAILGSLSMAMSEYMPLLVMMGTEASVDDLVTTIDTINNAKSEIAHLEAASGLRDLPGVECEASFSEMGLALQELADFIHVLPQ